MVLRIGGDAGGDGGGVGRAVEINLYMYLRSVQQLRRFEYDCSCKDVNTLYFFRYLNLAHVHYRLN